MLVQDFVNTEDREGGHDALSGDAAVRKFFQEQGLLGDAPAAAGSGQASQDVTVVEVRQLRAALRELIGGHNGRPDRAAAAEALNVFARRSGLYAGFNPDGSPAAQVTAGGVAGALGRLLSIAHDAAREGTWARLKTCREDSCRWVFYDQSRNHAGAWCSMAVCGTRAKMRQYRRRQPSANTSAVTDGGSAPAGTEPRA